MEQVNEMLRHELANLLSIEPPHPTSLVTVKSVKCSPDLQNATIFVSVLPKNFAGSVLKALRKNGKTYAKLLNGRIHLKYTPKFNWRLDTNEQYADEIEKAIKEL